MLNIALEVASQEGFKSTAAGEQGSAGTASLVFVGGADITGHMQTIADRAEQVSAQATDLPWVYTPHSPLQHQQLSACVWCLQDSEVWMPFC